MILPPPPIEVKSLIVRELCAFCKAPKKIGVVFHDFYNF
jgi:hypothetical protein